MADPTANLSGGPVLLSLSLATAAVALSTTFVRCFVRLGFNNGFGVDDYACGVATIIALIGTIFGIIESTASDSARALEFHVLGQPWFLMSATLSKISICLFFFGLLRRARQWRILLSVLIVVMAAVNFAFALAVNLQCRPLEKVWRPDVEGRCSDPSVQLNFGYFQGAFSVFSWVFLSLFPVLIVRDIPRHGEPKWPLYLTSVLTFACGIFSIVRTAQTTPTVGVSVYTIHYLYISLMANLEQNVALIAANTLTFGALFSSSHKHTPSSSTTTTASSSSRSRSRNGKKSRNRSKRDPYSSSGGSSSRSRRSGNGGSKRSKTPVLSSVGMGLSRAGSNASFTRPIIGAAAGTGVGGRDGSGAGLSREGSMRRTGSSRANSLREEVDIGERRMGNGMGMGIGTGVVGGEVTRRTTDAGLIIEGPGVGVGDRRPHGNNHNAYNGYDHSDDNDDNSGGETDTDTDTDTDFDPDNDDIDLEAWPRGIIKTVSVEVIEEIIVPANASGGNGSGGNNSNNTGGGAGDVVGRSGSMRGSGRNSVIIVPGGVMTRQQRGGVGLDDVNRGSGASGVEQDWEAMLRAGPPR